MLGRRAAPDALMVDENAPGIPIFLGPWGDNFGVEVDPNWSFPSRMTGNFTRAVSVASPLGGTSQPSRRINAIAMSDAEKGVAYVVDADSRVNMTDVDPSTAGGGDVRNAWNSGNVLYLGGADANAADARLGTRIRTHSVNYKGTISLNSSTSGFVIPANVTPIVGIQFSMMKCFNVAVTIIGQKQRYEGTRASRAAVPGNPPVPAVTGILPSWGQIFDYGIGSKNEANVYRQQNGTAIRRRFTSSSPKISFNYGQEFKILLQRNYMVTSQMPIIPVKEYYTLTAVVDNAKSIQQRQAAIRKNENSGAYSTAVYDNNNNSSTIETQATNILYLITSTDLCTGGLLQNTFGINGAGTYEACLQSIYPTWNCITAVGKSNANN